MQIVLMRAVGTAFENYLLTLRIGKGCLRASVGRLVCLIYTAAESLMTSICPVKKCNVVIIHRTDLIMEDMSGISDRHEKLRRTHPWLRTGLSSELWSSLSVLALRPTSKLYACSSSNW